MRADPAEFEMIAPPTLRAALQILSEQPKVWLPIAGGTDVMVQFAAGTLVSRKLLSLWNLPELRSINAAPDELQIGAGSTYTDIRHNGVVTNEFPLLARAAGWTGGIANQNRGTLGGNIVNASPAADSLPALLAYEAELILISIRGERRIPYRDFHTGYKQMNLASDELIMAVCLPRRFSDYVTYSRKVGARNAQAISKVCIAALSRIENGLLRDVRIALGSVAPLPIRLYETERIMKGKAIDEEMVAAARKAAIAEVRPITDIRSTARYRSMVVGNLVVEFLNTLTNSQKQRETLALWNRFPVSEAESEILACCGSLAWARALVNCRPIATEADLFAASDEIWRSLDESDWLEAFRSHPRIGESQAAQKQTQRSADWSAREQSAATATNDQVRLALAEGNREYERRFGYIFIVCASGKSASDILEILQHRLQNDPATELREAAEQQRQITNIRLKRWLAE